MQVLARVSWKGFWLSSFSGTAWSCNSLRFEDQRGAEISA
jgi:hypothetical protein